MEIALTWDLFVIVFFAVIISYSFIVGKHESIKIIIATYIAILAVQGVGNIIERLSGETEPVLDVLGVSVDITLFSTTKLLLFVVAIIILAVRGGFEVEFSKETNGIVSAIITGLFGFGTAGLLLSTLITYLAGMPLLSSKLAEAPAISPLLTQSKLIEVMIVNQDLWFSFPALLLLCVGFLGSETE
jgi:uncharacterized membrane protein YcfT